MDKRQCRFDGTFFFSRMFLCFYYLCGLVTDGKRWISHTFFNEQIFFLSVNHIGKVDQDQNLRRSYLKLLDLTIGNMFQTFPTILVPMFIELKRKLPFFKAKTRKKACIFVDSRLHRLF